MSVYQGEYADLYDLFYAEKPYDDDEDEDEMCGGTVMSVANPGACIGCEACARACAKKAQTHIAA